MITTRQFMLITGLLILTGFPPPSYAQNITVTFEGDQTCTKTGTGKVQIVASAGTWSCGAYTFKPKSTGDAEVVASDGNNDTLTLQNIKISRSSTTVPDLHITFSAGDFTDPPTSGSTADVWYKVSADGFFKRGLTSNLAVDSYLKTRGYLQTPSTDSNAWYMLGSDPPSLTGIELNFTVCGTAGCSNYTPATYHTETHFTGSIFASTRVQKGEIWVKLNASNDTLSLNFVRVENTLMGQQKAPCDPTKDEDCPPQCPETQCVQCFTKKQSNWLCNIMGLFCPSCSLP
nr:hypothetical protein [Nitrospirota bacterium]